MSSSGNLSNGATRNAVMVGALVALSAGAASAEARGGFRSLGYELLTTEAGVSVYKDEDADIIRLAAEGVVAATPAEVQRALLDYEGQVGRIDRLATSRVLKRGDSWLRVYQRLDLPIISDRDFVLKVRWGTRGAVRWIRYDAERRQSVRQVDGVVRVRHHEGAWQLIPLAEGQGTLVRFQMSLDIAGSVPRWLARRGAGDEVPALYNSLRAMVRSYLTASRTTDG